MKLLVILVPINYWGRGFITRSYLGHTLQHSCYFVRLWNCLRHN